MRSRALVLLALAAVGCGYPEFGFVPDDATLGDDATTDLGVTDSTAVDMGDGGGGVDTLVAEIGNDTTGTDTTPVDTFVIAPDTTPPPDAIPPDGGTCSSGRTLCAGSCVDTALDPTNCGGCGTKCNGGKVCSAKSCVCLGGKTDCGAGCVDTASDPAHCGSSCTVCGAGMTCSSGVCTCPSGSTMCGSKCSVTAGDPDNCGGCGRPCGQDQYCNAGSCACRDFYKLCGSTCVDAQSDPNNCGGCGALCSNVCHGSSCVPTFAYTTCAAGEPGSTSCGPFAPSGGITCVHPDGYDNGNCGGCGIKCGNDQLCAKGVCRTYFVVPGCSACPCAGCGAGSTCCGGTAGPLCLSGTGYFCP